MNQSGMNKALLGVLALIAPSERMAVCPPELILNMAHNE